MTVNQDPWPFMPPQSTEMLLMHCDDTAYTATPDTVLYKLVDAICGTTGAGALVNEIFIARAAGALETIYFNDLDYIFSKVNFLARSPDESYPYNPLVDSLTSDQWNEVRTKDAWYRARVKDFFLACGLGTTVPGIKMCVQAALAVDCDVFEVWRYIDNFGMTENLGRAPMSARNELVVRPHKASLLPEEFRLVRDMLGKMVALDTIVTVNVDGLSVQTPVPVTSAAADSTYYEVQKLITPTPLMSQLPPPEMLPIDLLPSEQWMYSNSPTLAPYAAFNITSEYSYFYLIGGGKASPIDSVTYGTINAPVSSKITVFELFGTTASGATIPANSWVFSGLDPGIFQWTRVSYQADMYTPEDSITAGVTALTSAINACQGSFVIVGYGPGAIIASNVYEEIQSGSLTARRAQFLAGVVFGNPRRQAAHTFPGSTYTHGQGVFGTDLLTTSESLWYEFVVPGDTLADVTSTLTADKWYARLFEAFYADYNGNISATISGVSPAVPSGSRLLAVLLDAYYSSDPTNVHNQYQTYQPLLAKGDHRTCTQIAVDYISGLPAAIAASVGEALVPTYPVCAFEVGGPELTNATTSWFATNLDQRIKYIWTPWPVTTYPLNDAVTIGVNNLITQINRNPGKFVLIGRGLGAIVTSLVYEQITSGTLQHRAADLVGAVAIGNPMRQAGKIAPGVTDPGGHGVDGTRLLSTPDLWWEFADPGDMLAVQGDDTTGTWMSTLFDAIAANYTGSQTTITGAYTGAPVNVALMTSNLIDVIYLQGGVATADYSTDTPLAGDARSSWEVARDYIDTFASLYTPGALSPADPMDTYQPEANFESFDTSENYGPWQTYEIADSPDNYPGGKFGKHRATAPALNPDGTPYNFPWPSQASFVAFKSAQIIAMGGQADVNHWRMPISATSTTKEVFLPEYAISYSAPAMDSTVSVSLTARRSKTVNQKGINQTFARVSTS